MAAPLPSRVVEEFPSTIALCVVSDTGVAASPFGKLAAIPGKCVFKDEEKEKT